MDFASQAWVLLLVAAAFWAIWKVVGIWGLNVITRKGEAVLPPNPYSDIEPLAEFDWRTAPKLRLRPFKDTYHLTMALQSSMLSDLFAVDKTYLNKIQLRRRLMQSQEQDIVGFHPVATEAVNELYEWVFGTYLPRRFPTMFRIETPLSVTAKTAAAGPYVRNLTTSELIPLQPPTDPRKALKTLGIHVDCDLLLLLPTPDPDGKPSRVEPSTSPEAPYHLHAFVACFPSGFNTAKKLGLPLAGIHAPVPGYGEKLQKSMDRYFAALPFGKVVKRVNWSCQEDDVLFKLDGNHLTFASGSAEVESPGGSVGQYEMAPSDTTPTEQDYAEWKQTAERIDPARCMLRTERQTLHRLERTGALLFAFKTYLYPLSEVKQEGLGAAMADAIDGLATGSVPGMRVYKRSVVWGSKIGAYLRDDMSSVAG